MLGLHQLAPELARARNVPRLRIAAAGQALAPLELAEVVEHHRPVGELAETLALAGKVVRIEQPLAALFDDEVAHRLEDPKGDEFAFARRPLPLLGTGRRRAAKEVLDIVVKPPLDQRLHLLVPEHLVLPLASRRRLHRNRVHRLHRDHLRHVRNLAQLRLRIHLCRLVENDVQHIAVRHSLGRAAGAVAERAENEPERAKRRRLAGRGGGQQDCDAALEPTDLLRPASPAHRCQLLVGELAARLYGSPSKNTTWIATRAFVQDVLVLGAYQECQSRPLVVDRAALAPLTAQLLAWRAKISEAHGLGWRLVVCQNARSTALRRCACHGRRCLPRHG